RRRWSRSWSLPEDRREHPIQLLKAAVPDLQHALAPFVPQPDLRAQSTLQLLDQVPHLRAAVSVAFLARQAPRLETLDQRLHRPDGEVFGDYLSSGLAQIALVGNREQRPGVSHAELAGHDGLLDGVREAQEAQRVRDRRPLLADARREFLLRQPVLLDQALVRLRLLDRVEVLALDVLDQRDLERLVVGDLANHHGQLTQPRLLRRPPSALAGDEHVPVAVPSDDQGQQHSLAADGLRQLLDMPLVEMASRLRAVRTDLLDAEVHHALALRGGAAGNQRPKPPAEGRPLHLRLRFRHSILLRLRVLESDGRGAVALQQLFRKLKVALRALRFDVVEDGRAAVARRLAQIGRAHV